MVKIEEKSLEERARETQLNDLAQMTKVLFGDKRIGVVGTSGFTVIGGTKDIYVNWPFKTLTVIVGHPNDFNTGHTMAKAYERTIGQEVVLKKDY